ncbi:MAG: 3-deoxy-manno-octulosonate cytidylyltransferase [Aestuariivita sp.]|nr:3-deoxy-manno-octulosonate cytidylyltransferase [Aestuariivita sp.]
MSVLLVIPARYESTRFPGKPLVKLVGARGVAMTLIERSWRTACQVSGIDRVVVATDDSRIEIVAQEFGAEVLMTSSECVNGTERCAEVCRRIGKDYEIVVNFQGDAPLTPPWFVEQLVAHLDDIREPAVATPVLRCNGAILTDFRDTRRAGRIGGTTAVFDNEKKAMYFSKEIIPCTSGIYLDEMETPVYHHVGVYAYHASLLKRYGDWSQGVLESIEGLEQLRFMENGHNVFCVEVDARDRSFWELNNPEDVARIEAMLVRMGVE